jgi:hypothetical protein
MARPEAGLCERRLNAGAIFSLLRQGISKRELENNSRRPEKLTKNGQSDSPNKRQLTLSHEVDEGGSCCQWRWGWVRTNQADHRSMWQWFWVLTKPCSGLSFYGPTMARKERDEGGQFSPYTGHVIGERVESDGQQGHIIRPDWGSQLPADHSCNKQGLWNAYKFTINILWLGKTNKAKFLFSRRYSNINVKPIE